MSDMHIVIFVFSVTSRCDITVRKLFTLYTHVPCCCFYITNCL